MKMKFSRARIQRIVKMQSKSADKKVVNLAIEATVQEIILYLEDELKHG